MCREIIKLSSPKYIYLYFFLMMWFASIHAGKMVPFIELMVAHASILTILAISFERYYAICEPLKAGYVCTKTRALFICIGCWLIAGLFTRFALSPLNIVNFILSMFYNVSEFVCRCCWYHTLDSKKKKVTEQSRKMRRYRALTRKLRSEVKRRDRFKVKLEDVEGNCQHCHWKAVIDISKSQPESFGDATIGNATIEFRADWLCYCAVDCMLCVLSISFSGLWEGHASHCARQATKNRFYVISPPDCPAIEKLLSLIRISHRDVTPRELLFLFGKSTDCFTQRNSKFHCWNVTQTHTKVMNSRRSINLHRKSPPRSSLVLAAQEEFLLIFKSSPLLLWLRQDRVNISSAGYAQRREERKKAGERRVKPTMMWLSSC